jgi:hypothetical protein
MTSFYAIALVTVFAGAIGSSMAQTELAHTREEFSFVLNASYDKAFPLFGAWEERKWALGFEPQFVFPSSPQDQQGMVFTTNQHGANRIWVNTAFDRNTGKAQYVYFIPETMVAFIDVQLTRLGSSQTTVSVVYERTALKPEANEDVLRMAKDDAKSGPHWAQMINEHLARERANAPHHQ